ncbi:aromatic ring-opening dioxygenase LigA [Cellulomonas composti]|uniref:Aromatic ring-opening dioxygenase LigA n=1 Tax=Cellulomonas composti TaxID=266130 RepID=A0A511J7S7_9CELL|nr:aromatic ring-opening dioxygenase LigA [Cellulomonas composti]GEL93763.1 hypothetical protein CCO02nite_04210 [Cellulomonas composti]
MSTSATGSSNGLVRLLALITIIFGGVFIVAGAATWIAVSVNLKAENITVSDDAEAFAGQTVDTPWEAWSQAAIINHHALAASGGLTYAEIGAEMTELKADLAAQGLSDEEIAANEDLIALQNTRTTVMNGSFLRASLFTSVIAFGVALLVVGLGAVVTVIGVALRKLAPAVQVEAAAPATPATA